MATRQSLYNMHLSTLMPGLKRSSRMGCAAGVVLLLVATALAARAPSQAPAAPRSETEGLPDPGPQAAGQSISSPQVKAEPKKAKEVFKKGVKAEQAGDWQAAHEAYASAVAWDPSEREYVFRRDMARSHLVQAKVDVAEREAISGRLKEARKELLDAIYLDPTNRLLRDRLTELNAIAPDDPSQARKEAELA